MLFSIGSSISAGTYFAAISINVSNDFLNFLLFDSKTLLDVLSSSNIDCNIITVFEHESIDIYAVNKRLSQTKGLSV